MAALKGMTALTHLSLDETKVTDAGLSALKGRVEMEQLSLGYVSVRGPGLANLKGMSRLKSLSFVCVAQTEHRRGRFQSASVRDADASWNYARRA